VRRAGNFAVNRPAREVLFTVVSSEDRYKTKGFIDTFVYRAGDQIGAWAYAPMAAFGFGIPGVSAVGVVLAVVSVINAVWLGLRWQRIGLAPAQQHRSSAPSQLPDRQIVKSSNS
jgi:ATP:ADP antiporter, AAA family